MAISSPTASPARRNRASASSPSASFGISAQPSVDPLGTVAYRYDAANRFRAGPGHPPGTDQEIRVNPGGKDGGQGCLQRVQVFCCCCRRVLSHAFMQASGRRNASRRTGPGWQPRPEHVALRRSKRLGPVPSGDELECTKSFEPGVGGILIPQFFIPTLVSTTRQDIMPGRAPVHLRGPDEHLEILCWSYKRSRVPRQSPVPCRHQ